MKRTDWIPFTGSVEKPYPTELALDECIDIKFGDDTVSHCRLVSELTEEDNLFIGSELDYENCTVIVEYRRYVD